MSPSSINGKFHVYSFIWLVQSKVDSVLGDHPLKQDCWFLRASSNLSKKYVAQIWPYIQTCSQAICFNVPQALRGWYRFKIMQYLQYKISHIKWYYEWLSRVFWLVILWASARGWSKQDTQPFLLVIMHFQGLSWFLRIVMFWTKLKYKLCQKKAMVWIRSNPVLTDRLFEKWPQRQSGVATYDL